MKILLVDDEYYILTGLYRLIHSQFPELEIFTADYVKKAKEIIYKEKPDILITDIRIAEDNGLDLIKSIKNDFEDMHVYVISGYSEFEYAKTAIELNVKYYILKPINQKKVVELVKSSMEEITQRQAWKENQIRTLELARKKIVLDMIAEGGCTEEMLQELKRLRMDSFFERYRVVNVRIKEYWIIATYHRSVQLSNLKMFMWKKLDSILRESGWGKYLLIEDETGNYTLIVTAESKSLDWVLHQIYLAIYENFKLYTEFRISKEFSGTDKFYEAYCESQGITAGTSRMIFYNENEGKIIKELEQIRYEAVRYMRDENYMQLAALIELIIARCYKENAHNEVVKNFVQELYKEFITYISEKKVDFSPKEEQFENLEEAYTYLAKELKTYQQEINALKNYDMVQKVLDYMDSNISNVTLDNAAGYVGTTPIYLSIIFKEIEGINFKECLIQKKMTKAKQLLEQTTLRIYEISGLVGYSDIKYFSKIFKRYAGAGPQEYRNQYFEKEKKK